MRRRASFPSLLGPHLTERLGHLGGRDLYLRHGKFQKAPNRLYCTSQDLPSVVAGPRGGGLYHTNSTCCSVLQTKSFHHPNTERYRSPDLLSDYSILCGPSKKYKTLSPCGPVFFFASQTAPDSSRLLFSGARERGRPLPHRRGSSLPMGVATDVHMPRAQKRKAGRANGRANGRGRPLVMSLGNGLLPMGEGRPRSRAPENGH